MKVTKAKHRSLLFDLSLDMLGVAQLDGNFVELNPAWEKTLSWSQTELCAQPLLSFIHPQDQIATENVLAKLRAGSSEEHFENRFRCQDGSYRWLAWRVTSDLTERVFIVVARDISEQKLEAAHLLSRHSGVQLLNEIAIIANSASNFATAIKATIDCFCEHLHWPVGHCYIVADVKASPIKMVSSRIWHLADSSRFATFKSISEEFTFEPGIGLPGSTYNEQLPQWRSDINSDPEFLRIMETRIQTDLRSAFTIPIRTPSQLYGVIELFSDKVQERDSSLLELAAIAGHLLGRMEERQRTYSRLQESERLINAVLQTLPVAVIAKDIRHDFRISLWNRKAQDVFGLIARDCLGQRDSDLLPPEMAARFRKTDEWALRSPGILDIPEEQAETQNGILTLHTQKTVIRDGQGQPQMLLIVSEDITARKEAEKIIERQRAEIVAASKIASLGEMAGGVAHEINNPLTIINGNIRRLKKFISDPEINIELLFKHLDIIETMTLRIAKIVKGMRLFSGDSAGDPMATHSLATIISDTVSLCSERFSFHGIDLQVQCAFDPIIVCRQIEVAQVLMNLLNNAFDAVALLEQKWVRLEVNLIGQERVALAVTDSGFGIAKDIVSKMMDPFFTTKTIGKGTGLGLSISAGIAAKHHGELRYDPDSQHTRFILELPLVPAKLQQAS